MAFDFPNSPTTGQIVTGPNNIQYRWDGVKWVAATASGMIGGPGITISDTPPASPSLGNLWFDSVGLQLYVWYTDPTSSQWVPVTSQSGLAAIGATNTGRNLLHNPMFTVQQRGQGPWTTFQYNADRWAGSSNLDTISFSVTTLLDADRTQIGDEAAEYGYQCVFTGNSGAASYTTMFQRMEDVRRLSNKTVTVSFWALASAALKIGVSLDQLMGSGGSPSPGVFGNGQAVTLTTTWARYSLTFTLPSVAGKTLGTNNDSCTGLNFWYSSGTTQAARAGNIGVQAGTISLWGVQLEIGNVATPLAKRDPADELALCQRFYIKGANSFSLQALTALGGSYGGWIVVDIMFPVTMRANPTVTTTYLTGTVSSDPGILLGIQTQGFLAWANNAATSVGQYASYSWTASADL